MLIFVLMGQKPHQIKVVYKKLKDARGYYYNDPKLIVIDKTLTDLELLDTLIHEFTHHIQPYLDEDVVEKIGNEMSAFLWKHNYRKNENK
jgi:hypothetical protein